MIVGGHSHSLLSKNESLPYWHGPYPTTVTNLDGSTTYVVQAHRFGKYMGVVHLSYDAENKLTFTGDPILLDQSIPKHTVTHAAVKEWKKVFENQTKTIIGISMADYSFLDCREDECGLGNLVTTAFYHHFNSTPVDFAFLNEGGMRSGFLKGTFIIYYFILQHCITHCYTIRKCNHC